MEINYLEEVERKYVLLRSIYYIIDWLRKHQQKIERKSTEKIKMND